MPRRSGRWARRRAWAAQWRFLRSNPLPIGVFVTFDGLFAWGVAALAPAPGNLFVAGVLVGALPLALLLVAQSFTGAAGTNMGATAEGWTSSELRRFIRKARREQGQRWWVIDHIPITGWDVDHVLFGPGGVYAIESKWSAEGWATGWARGRLADIARSARVDARKVQSILRSEPHHLTLDVTPLVVVWPNSAERNGIEAQEGTEIVFGGDLVLWCSEQRGELDAATADAACRAIAQFVRMRERHELKEGGAGLARRFWYRLWFDPRPGK